MATDLFLPPVVVNEYVTVNSGQLVSAPASVLLSNDSDPDGGALKIVKFGQASHGAFIAAEDGTVSYVSQLGYEGQDSVTYVVEDADGNQTTGTIFFTVVATENKPPLLQDDAATVQAGQAVTADPAVLLANDLDPNGDKLTIKSFGKPTVGTLVQNADGTITYTAPPDYSGPAEFTYTVTDGRGGESTATVRLTVAGVINGAPILQDEVATVQAGQPVTADPSLLLANDSDPNGDKLTIVSYGKPTVGTLVQNADGTITYTAPADYNGPAEFTYKVSDGRGGESTATVRLTVTGGVANTAPLAVDDAAVVAHNGSSTINVLANDTDANGDKLSVSAINQPAHGTATLNADGTVTYKANAGYSGADSFTYTVADGRGGTSIATVKVTVEAAPNVAPVAVDDAAAVAYNGSSIINVLANDTDGNGDKLAVTSVNQPAHGTATLNADGTVTYKANAGYSGADSFTYTISDGKGGVSTASVSVKVALKTADLSQPDMVDASDSGSSVIDNYTKLTKPGFMIGALPKAGDVANLYVDGIKQASIYDAATGVLTPVNALSAAIHKISYTYTNAAGVESARSAELYMTIDTTAPIATTPDLMVSSDWGTSSTDNLTSDNTPTFYVKVGESVIESRPDRGLVIAPDNVTLLVDGKEVEASFDFATGAVTPLSPIADGQHSIAVKLTDAAGNVSALSTALSVTIDTARPAAPVNTPDLLTSADSGSSNTDNITANTKPGFVVGEKVPGGDILLVVDGVQVAASYDAVAKTLTPTVALAEGVHQVSFINVSPSGVQSSASPALTVDIDAVKERPTNAADMVASSDSGLSQADNITNISRPSFAVGAPPKAGDVMNLYIDGKKVDAVYDAVQGTLTPTAALSDGTHYVAWSVTNAAGVESPVAALGDRSGLNGSYFNGTGLSGAAVLTRVDDNVSFSWAGGAPVSGMADAFSATWTGSLATPASGSYVFQASSDDGIRLYIDGQLLINHWVWEAGVRTSAPIVLSAGRHDIRVDFADFGGHANIDLRWQVPGQQGFSTIPSGAGNAGLFAYAGDAFTVDTAAPAAFKADLLSSSDWGISNSDDLTSNSRPSFNVGAVGATDRVSLLVDGVMVEAVYDAATKTITPTTAIADGAHSITLQVTDVAGNTSAASAALMVNINTTKPAAPVNMPDMVNADDTGISNTDNITANTQPRFIVGEAPPNGKIELLVDGQVVSSTYDASAKTLKPDAPLAEGEHQVSMRYVSPSGVVSAASPALAIEIDAIVDTAADRRASINLVAFEDSLQSEVAQQVVSPLVLNPTDVQTYRFDAVVADSLGQSTAEVVSVEQALDLRDLLGHTQEMLALSQPDMHLQDGASVGLLMSNPAQAGSESDSLTTLAYGFTDPLSVHTQALLMEQSLQQL